MNNEHMMITKNEENIYERSTCNVMNKGRDAFISYDVATDCIDPDTGEPLIRSGDDVWERYFSYINNDADYDAENSLEANIIYRRVYGDIIDRIDRKEIRPQLSSPNNSNRYYLKYEVGEPHCTGGLSFRGCVMNTAAITNKAYYWERKNKYKGITGIEFPWPREALEFMDLCNTPGNFLILPYMRDLDIGKERGYHNRKQTVSSSYRKDYFDIFLAAIYNFFLEQAGRERYNDIQLGHVIGGSDNLLLFMTYYLLPYIRDDESRFDEEGRQLIDDIEDGSRMICHVVPGWESFVEKNMLQDFVKRGFYDHFTEPYELWTGHFEMGQKTAACPIGEDCFHEYWTKASDMIRKRSARIYDRLHEQRA